jgi:hypothetical protein
MSDGIIRSEEAFNQPLHFEGVQFPTGNNAITPTDFDAVIEFRDKLFIIVEVKRRGMEIPTGQKWALENVCKAINGQPGKTCVIFKCWHDVPKPEPVMLKHLTVQSFFWDFGPGGYSWRDSDKERTLIDSVNKLLDFVGISPDEVRRCESPEKTLDMAHCPF